MKKRTTLLLTLITLFFMFSFKNYQENEGLIRADFMEGTVIGQGVEKGEYTTKRDPILQNQWNRTQRSVTTAGESPVAVEPLVYDGYIESGKSNAMKLQKLSEGARLTGYSLTQGNAYASGVYYLAMMTRLDKGSGGVFISLDGSYLVDFQKAHIVARRKGKEFSFGLMNKWGDDAVRSFSEGTYAYDQTHLLVLKYDIAANKAQLYVNPDLNAGEPAKPLAEVGDVNLKMIKTITVRQDRNISCTLGGLRFATTWEAAIGKL